MEDILRVLYVDDEPALLKITQLFLEKDGSFQVDTLTSAGEALEKLNTERYDAIVSDYQMPEMDGIQFLIQLKASGNTTPFIIFTGKGREEIVIEALNRGADFYIQKGGDPVAQFAELVHKIRTAIYRQRIEKRARDTERRLFDIINFLPDATFAIDNAGRVIAWNKAIEEMTGVSAHDMLGKGNREYSVPFYGERRPILIDLVSVPVNTIPTSTYGIIQKEGDILTAETALPRPLGKYSVLLCKASLLYNDEGNVIGAIESIRDITGQKRTDEDLLKKNAALNISYEQIAANEEELRANMEEMARTELALRESEEKFKTLFESAGDGILIIRDDIFVDCNRKAEEIYRRRRDEVLGHSPADFSPDYQLDGVSSAGRMRKNIDAALQGENRFFEWIHTDKDGERFIVEVSLDRFRVHDTDFLQAIVRDITRRKQNEEQTAGLSELKEKLLGRSSLTEQLKLVSDSCVTIFGADFARIWLMKEADLCEKGCRHAVVSKGPGVCRNRSQCLHLAVSSGRYTHIDGGHQRVPAGCYKIGGLASGEDAFFVTNDVVHDPRVHDHEWAQSLGLVSFAGFRLVSRDKKPVGVLALFRKKAILPGEEDLLVDLANTLSQVIVSGNAEEALRITNEELHASYEQIAATEEELRANLDEMIRQDLALRESEERYRQFFRTTLDSVFITTVDGRWVDFNDSMLGTFGYGSREEVFALPVSAVYAYPEERPGFISLVEREGYVKEHPLRFRKKDGTIFNGLITIVPQKSPDGSVKGFVGTVHDITGKKRIYEPVPGPEPFNRSRAENKADYIVVYGDDGKILYANPATIRALGYDGETITGTPLLTYVAEDCRGIAAAKMREREESGEIPMYEIEIVTREGLRRSVIVKGTQVVFDRKPATLLLFIDITRRKELEDQLIARATDLSQISTAFQRSIKKLNLLSTVTRHDINNQLMVLMGYLELIEETALDSLQKEYFLMVASTAERISAMIRFTKEYEEIGVYAPAWVDCREVADIAAKEIDLRKVTLINDIPTGTEILADPLIFRVFYNLMDNAMRYGSRITEIRLFTEKRGSDLIIICEDDGEGVPAGEKEKIFERGFGKNTGLGLFLSREILSITGIAIAETGECGKGARFEIAVPEGTYR